MVRLEVICAGWCFRAARVCLPSHFLEDVMNGTLARITRTVAAGLALAIAAACSDAGGGNPASPDGARPRLLTAGGYQLLASGPTTLTPSSGLTAISYTIGMPASGPIRLSFTGRIDWTSTAGNSNVLEILVNGNPVTLGNKFIPQTYLYANLGFSEDYYDDRGAGWGQPGYLWGLFWSPDYTANNIPSDSYFVWHGDAYSYDFDITNLVNLGASNTITLTNRGGWVVTATGNTPNVVLQTIAVRNF
jgi:hypothetical protein